MCKCNTNIETDSNVITGSFDTKNLALKKYLGGLDISKSITTTLSKSNGGLMGTVVDNYGDPVMGAHVYVDQNTGAVTDFNGNFSISGVEPFTPVTVSYTGHATLENIVVGADPLILTETAEQLDAVYITNKKPFPWVWIGAGAGVLGLSALLYYAYQDQPVKAII